LGEVLLNGDRLQAARDFLIRHRTDHDAAVAGFAWPRFEQFNFAFDWFDRIAERSDAIALSIASPRGLRAWSYRDLSLGSNRVAHFLRRHGIGPGDRLLIALGNRIELWETQLAAMKAGCVMVPCTVMLGAAELRERMARSGARAIVADDSIAERLGTPDKGWIGFNVDAPRPGWIDYGAAYGEPAGFAPDQPTRGTDPLLIYFTSGTTAQPKMVTHSHVSYPVGHLSTLYWIGLKPGDTHLNISSPGWAKHAWSSFYAPWLAEASILTIDQPAFDARFVLDQIRDRAVDCFCAPPTVWRMLLQERIEQWPVRLREAVSAGEPLNPHVVERVREVWGIDVRDGYGQTETTAQIGNTPGQPLVAGAMGRPWRDHPARRGHGRGGDARAAGRSRQRGPAAIWRYPPDRRHRLRRTGRHADLYRPRRRCLQIERLQDQPLRNRERPAGTSGSSRIRRHPQPRANPPGDFRTQSRPPGAL
jgi:acetyl-CoA synthetase